MSLPPLKSLLLVLAAISQRVGIKPPHPPPTKDDRVLDAGNQFFEKFARRMGAIMQIIGIGTLISESAMLLALHFQSTQSASILSTLCPNPSTTHHGGLPSLSSLSTLSPRFILGVSLMYSATLLRVWCYNTLGTLFTYEITIRRNHKLITTGPYAFVRHPAYTGSVLLMIGTALTVFGPHGYVSECGVMTTSARWMFVVWGGMLAYTIVSLVRRGGVEDSGLGKEFGSSWEVYKQKVPRRFVPGII